MYDFDKNNKTFHLKINYIVNNLMTDGLLLFQEFEKMLLIIIQKIGLTIL